MSRLIDADALKKTVDDFPNCYNGWSDTYDKAYIIEAIEEAPTIDAVEVVRCKDCKYWNTKDCRDGVGECEWAYYMTEPNDFCSYGERKESE